MEVSGVVLSRQVSGFISGARLDTPSSSSSKLSSLNGMSFAAGSGYVGEIRLVRARDCGVYFGNRRIRSAKNIGFYDKGNLDYYYVSPRCGGKKIKKEKIKNKVFSGDLTAEKFMLIKGLKENFSAFSEMGLRLESPLYLGSQVEEDSELLLKQFQQLRAEKKEFKRLRKQEKAKLKAAKRSANMLDSESSSSSSSSESSDGECEGVNNINSFRKSLASIQPKLKEVSLPFPQEITTLSLPSLTTTCQDIPTRNHGFEEGRLQNQEEEQEHLNRSSSLRSCSTNGIDCVNDSITRSSSSATSTRIEVCMGNKCKKAGGVALLKEFEKVMGVEGSVVGCKCMGKCKDGPNVRVLNFVDETQGKAAADGSLKRVVTNPLCIGVGLDDVGAIVSNLCGGDKKDLGLIMAP